MIVIFNLLPLLVFYFYENASYHIGPFVLIFKVLGFGVESFIVSFNLRPKKQLINSSKEKNVITPINVIVTSSS
uniref:Serpentine receptor class gamma n=1 Tax=Caenorhabditis tropicalis TaxID=1561998 RepID=A0A1I7T6E1_9PELO